MRYKQLGRTGLFVSEICLGTMTFGKTDHPMWHNIAALDQAGATAMVERSIGAGVNFIDTADVYTSGDAEKMLGHALRDVGVRRQDVVIATKVHGAMSAAPNDRGASRGHIMDSVAQSLERMQVDHIDLYQIHGIDPVTPIEETLRALDDLVRQGMVRYIGVSNWEAWRMAKALGLSDRLGLARVETVQAYYSIAGRDLEREIVPLIEEERLGLMVWSPLAGGLLSGKFGPGAPGDGEGRRAGFAFPPVDEERGWNCVAAMRGIAEKHGATVATVALAWVLSRSFVMSVIVGARRMDQLDQNLAAAELTLDADDLATLESISALPSEYPGWMRTMQTAGRVPQPFVKKG